MIFGQRHGERNDKKNDRSERDGFGECLNVASVVTSRQTSVLSLEIKVAVKGSCHCGNVTISLPALPASLTSCNCSICNRLGALWGYYPPGDVALGIGTGSTQQYVWGEGNIAFHHCPNCGCVTHYATTEQCQEQKIGVNFKMMKLAVIESLPVKKFDGADTWSYTDE